MPVFATHSRLQPSPLSRSTSHKDSSHISNSATSNPLTGPVANGTPKEGHSKPSDNPLTSSPASCPPPSKRKKLSPEVSSSRARGKSSDSRLKPVISPIHFGNDAPIRVPIQVGSGDSNSEGSGSPRENGVVPKQYLGDYSKHRSHNSKHHRHRHRHHGSSGGTKSRRHEHHRDREEGGRNSRRDQHQSSKRRRTELERYR